MELKHQISQRLGLTQALQRSLEILQLPAVELSALILEEVEKNPLLELESSGFGTETTFPEIEAKPSLYDHLMAQIREAFDGEERQTAVSLLEKIDERGFLNEEAPDAILTKLQQFDPPGIFARTLKEAFLLQLDKGEISYSIVEHHYEDLLAGRFKKLEKCYGIELAPALKKLSRLSTRPASSFEHTIVRCIYPDMRLVKRDKKWNLESIEDALPKFRIKTEYNEIPNIPKEERETLRSFAVSAKWLKRSIERRRKMILELGKHLIQKQSVFLNNEGPLAPLSPNELATLLGVHESTISRALSDKYLEGPSGLIQLKALVSSHGNESAKDLLQRLIASENKVKPLTDQELVEQLKKAGHKVARRTISKYRDQLNIGSASTRKNGI